MSFRLSTVGQLINYASNGRLLPYADQRRGYVVPAQFLQAGGRSSRPGAPLPGRVALGGTPTSAVADNNSHAPTPSRIPSSGSTLVNEGAICAELDKELEKNLSEVDEKVVVSAAEGYPWLVAFEEGDRDRPMNWKRKKRVTVAVLMMIMTCSVYIGSAIYTSSIPGIEERFGVKPIMGTLGLSLFVCGYGLGPMLLSPLADVVSIGRTPIYITSLFLYVVFQVPVIFAPNIGTILVFRFLAGFVGSPALSTAGTTLTEVFHEHAWPYAIGVWALSGCLGPILGPVIGGFAAQANGWRWPIYELLWMSSFALITLSLFLPETSEDTILYRRACRLRKLTGNALLKTAYELESGEEKGILASVADNFVIGLQISMDPAIAFANIYIGLVYAIFYLWFEMFPVVFSEYHGFNLGVSGLPYLGFVVTGSLALLGYIIYNRVHLSYRRVHDPNFGPETRLEIGLFAGWFIPISLFIFGWGAHSHWTVPVIGAALYLPGIYLLFQSIIMFISMYVKPKYNSAVMASNCLFRSSLAATFPLFGKHFVDTLGVGPGCSLLAGISIVMIGVLYLLYRNAKGLRMRSKWGNHAEKILDTGAGH